MHILELPPLPADDRLFYGEGESQFADLRVPTGDRPHPVVVVIHGGYWRRRYDLTHVGHVCEALRAAGYATWSLEYRRIGNGGGWPETFEDVARGADALHEAPPVYGLDLERVIALGHSAGGQLALWLAGRPRIPGESGLSLPPPIALRGAVSLAGVVDLRLAWELGVSDGVVETFLGGSPSAVPDRYAAASPLELLPLGVPQVLLHGTADDSVPYELSQRYVERAVALGDPARLVTLPKVGHFELIDPRWEGWKQVEGAIRELAGV